MLIINYYLYIIRIKLMVLQSSGPIKFSQIRAEFNPTGSDSLIRLSNYNNSISIPYYYGSLPSPNSRISLNNFYGISTVLYNNNYVIIENKLVKNALVTNGATYFIYTNTGNYVNKLLFNRNTYCSILLVGGGAPRGGPSSRSGYLLSGGAGGNVNYISSYLFYENTSYDVFVGDSQKASYITSNNNNFFYTNGGTERLDFFAGGTNTQFYKNNILISTYTGVTGFSYYSDDIGGGGSGAGGNAYSLNTYSVNGGIGYLSTITGNSQYYGGGGAGYSYDYDNNVLFSNGSNYGGFPCTYGGGGSYNLAPQQGCVIISPNNIYQEIYVNDNQVDWIYNYNLSIKYYIFLTNNKNSIKFVGSVPGGKLLIVGGGGAGGFYQYYVSSFYVQVGAGGGGGFVYYHNSFTFLGGTYTINVGNYGNPSIITLPFNTTIMAAAGENAKSPSGVVRPTIGGNSGSTIHGISGSTSYTGGNETLFTSLPNSYYIGGSGAGASGNGISGQQNFASRLGGTGYTCDITGTNVIYSPGGNGTDTNNNSTNYGAGGNSAKNGNPGCVIIQLPI